MGKMNKSLLRTSLKIKANLKRIFILSAIAILLVAIAALGATSISDSDEIAFGTQLKEGFMHDAETPTALKLKDSDLVYNTSSQTFTLTITNSIGTSSSGISTNNVSMTWTSKDRDDDGMYGKYTGNMEKPDGYGFSVERLSPNSNTYNYGSYNAFGAVLNLELPQFMQDLINSGTVKASATAKLSMRQTWNALGSGEYHMGIAGGSSLIKPSQQNVSNWDNRPSAASYLSGFTVTDKQWCNDGDWGDTITDVSVGDTTIGGKYLGIGLSGMSDHWPGYSTPDARLTSIVVTFKYSATIKISADSHAAFDYRWYGSATPTSFGALTESKTITAGNSVSKSTTNPYAFMSITPKTDLAGYRFKEVVANTTNALGATATTDFEKAPTCTIASITTTGGYTPEGSATGKLRNNKNGNSVNSTARKYNVVYRSNGGSGSDTTKTYDYDTSYSTPNPADFGFSKKDSVPAGWTYTSDNKPDISNTNRGKQYSSGNTFSNLFPNLNNNTTTLYFDTVWVEAAPTNKETSFVKMEISAYSDKYSDVEITITATKTGHTLKQVYATYTSGDINGTKIALEYVQNSTSGNKSRWMLYGISGNCDITTEWVANQYTITYDWNSGSGTNGPTTYYYGTTVTLPFGGTRDGYNLDGWTLTAASGGYATTGTQYTLPKGSYGNITAKAVWKSASVTPTQNADSTADSPDTTGVSNTGFNTAIKGLGKTYHSGQSTFDATEETAVTQKVDIPTSVQYALRTGATVKATIKGKLEVGTLNDNYVIVGSDPNASKAYGRIGINGTYASYLATSYTKVYDWDSSAECTSATQNATSAALKNTDTQVTVYVQLKREKVHKRGDAYFYAILTSFTITYSVSGGTPLTITYNGNGGTTSSNTSTEKSTYLQSTVGASATVSFPTSMFARNGYEFLGWSTTQSATSPAKKAGETASISSATTYYAIWKKKNYPVNTYDVWTDGTNYGATIRKQWYISHDDSVYLYTNNNSNTAYGYSGSSSNIYHLGGGGDYKGFTIGSPSYRIPSHNFQTHEYTYNSGNILATSNYAITGVTGAIWGFFVWNLKAPSATTANPDPVDYGTSIDMDELVTPSHEATEKEFSWDWHYVTGGGKVPFYQNHELFLVEENNKYFIRFTVKVVRGGVTLSKTAESDGSSTVTINPLRLKVEVSGNNEFNYNGKTHEFPLRTLLDEDYYKNLGYTADQIAYLVSVFEAENNDNLEHRPWFYDEAMEQENEQLPASEKRNLDKWHYGVAVRLIGLGYSSYIADGCSTDFYDGSFTVIDNIGIREFKDAGKYWASQLYIRPAVGNTVSSSLFNKNYTWSQNCDVNNGQIFSAEQANAEGTVFAEIKPANGFDIYAFYVQKTFGKIADPTPSALSLTPSNGAFDIEELKNGWALSDDERFEENWLLAITGLVNEDFDLYGKLVASMLRRDTSAPLHQRAGLYDVYLDTFSQDGQPIVKELLALLNNYGVKLESNTATVVREGFATVKMHWVNQDGTIKNGEFDFTTDISAYNGERNNFEIVPKDIELIYDGKQNNFTYNGSPQGPSNIISQGYLTDAEKQAFAAEYGDGYERLFEIYFYGIPLSSNLDWNAMSEEEQLQYIEDNKGSKAIIGYDGLNYINGVGDKYAISLFEKNAGKYAVVIIGAAYKDADGNDHDNASFNLSSHLYLYWEIKQKAIEVASSYTSMTFGDKNYGGARYTMSEIVGGDKIQIKNLTISYNNKSSDGFLRYNDLTADAVIVNGTTLSVYGTFVGRYDVTMGGVITVDMTNATGLYGVSDENYGRSTTNYSISYDDYFTIINRLLNVGSTEYTADGGETFSTQMPDMTYVYGVRKGIRIIISNFYAADFLTDDIAATEGDNVFILASELVDTSRIKLIRTHENSECTVTTDEQTGSVTYVFTAINAATYRVNISDLTYTYNGTTYGNYDITERSTNYTIRPKTIKVQWFLDGNAVEGTNVPSVVYDGNAHSVYAQFVSAASGALSTTDGLVYFGDFKDATQIYSVYEKKSPLSLEFSAVGTDSYTDVNVVDDEDTPYETYLKTLTSGNYRLAEEGEGSYSLSWEITRREFKITVTNYGNTFIYDGEAQQVVLNLKSTGGVEVTLDNFGAILSSGAKFEISEGLIFNANDKSLSATESGIYTFSYDAESKIKIDKNWLLTGKESYTGDKFLFAIVPRVLTLRFNTRVATYTSNNLISRFRASYIDSAVSLPDGDTTFTYNLSEIIHAGTYSITVTGATSESGNFVLAETNPTEWYATIANGRRRDYYTNQTVIDGYTASVTVNPYTVTLDPVAINAGLVDYVYDGLEHGYTMEYLFENFVKSMLLCDADKEGYTLNGTSNTGKNVDTYEVKILGFNPLNGYTDYRLAQEEGYSDTWAITQRPLEFVYAEYHSGGNSFIYDGNNHGYALTVNNIVDGEAVQLVFVGTNLNITSPLTVESVNTTYIYGSAATNYSIINFSLADATVDGTTFSCDNYSLPEGGANKSWSIEKKTITVEWHNTELTYRASAYTPDNGGVYATVTNSVEGDVFTLNYGGERSATNAGEYTISIEDLTGGDYANYKIEGTLSTTWTIKAKELTEFVWTGEGNGFTNTPKLAVTYNGANHNIKATPVSGAENADDGKIYDKDVTNFKFTYSSASGYVTTALLAGEYTTKISGCNSINYTVPATADVEENWEILKRELTVSYRYNYGTTITYCAAARGVVLEISGFIASDFDSNLAFTVDTNVASDNGGTASGTTYTRTLRSIDVGDYTATVSIDETCARASCYTLSGTLNAAFTITALAVTLEWRLCDANHANRTAEYDGKPHELKATVTNLASSSDEVTVTVSGAVQTNQGKYTGVATSVDNKNYTLPESEAARSCEFTISPRAINAIWESTAETYTYNGKYRSDTLTLSRLIADDEVTFKVEFYKEASGGNTLFKTATVSKNGITEYDLIASDFQIIDAATYVAIFDGKVYNADGTVNTNYTYKSLDDDRRTRYTISRATLRLSGGWNYANDVHSGVFSASTILIYNAKPYTLTTSIDTDTLFVRDDTNAKDEVSIVYTGNVNTHVGVGKYTATASSLSGTYASNYRLPTEGVSVSYAITPKGVTLVWENYTGIVYDGQTHTVTAKVEFGGANDTDGLAYDGDKVTVNQYENNAYRGADTYTSTALSLDNDDYVIENESSLEWTIAPRPVELVWSDDKIEYDGTLKTVTATASNLIAGDSITPLTYENNQYTNKGTYTATVTKLTNTNYTLTDGKNISHEWEITPIVLAFGWSSASGRIYNGNAQGITLTISNIADADFENASSLSFTAEYTPADSQTATENRTANPIKITYTAINAGSYTINITALDGTSKDNYVLPDNVSATYVIAARVIDLDWTAGTFIYSKENHEVTASVTNTVEGDTLVLTYKTTDGASYSVSGLATVGNVAMHAGSYSTVVTAVDNKNYTVTGANDLTFDWTISPKTITDVTFMLDGKESLSATYDRTQHVLTATANGSATSADDGKIYDGDTVTFSYAGTVTENYGLSAINNNSALEAGEYSVSLSISDNDDYIVESLSCGFTVNRRTLTLTKEDVTSTSFVYDGKSQGVKITVNGLLEYDNNSTRFNLDGVISPSGTADSAVRSGANYSKRFLATDAGTYTLTFSLSGSRYQNYELTPFECSFTIIRKQITTQISADVTADNITYRAEAIAASDLSVTFNNLITGERLTLGDDFTVSFAKDGDALDGAPINVGTYTAIISLKNDGNSSVNYELIGTTEFNFDIKPYEIHKNTLGWTLNGNTVSLDALTFKDGENKTVTVGSVKDDVFNKIAGKSFSYVYFGLCNCGLAARSSAELDEEHLEHQWFAPDGNFRTEGPQHAGSYFVVLTLSGGDAENFVLTGFDGYTGDYFCTEDDETYLAYYRSEEKFTGTPLPKLSDNTQALRFGIGRLHQGVVVVGAKSSLPFKGTAYTVGSGLPAASAADTSNIRVEIGSGTYTYEAYSSATFNAIRNAGDYTIKIYDNSASGDSGTVSGCDLFNSDAEMEITMTLTVEKAKITVTDSTEPYWTKVYDRTTAYSGFAYDRNVTFTSTTDGDGNVIATSDGVLTGTTATVTAVFDNYNAGTRKLTFTLSGTDRDNYYIVLSKNGTVMGEDEYTVNGYTYAINNAEILKRTITVAGDADKVFDGTKTVQFEIVSADIISGDSVTVTGEYASEHVGTHNITLTATNDNYEVASDIAVRGTISPKPLTVVWARTDESTTVTYDGDEHGVTATISGMIDGYIEDITATIADISTTQITADTVYPVSFVSVNAGDYSVVLTLKENSDYSLSSSMDSAEWTISKRVLDISWITDDKADGAYIYEWVGFTVQFANVSRSITPQINNIVGDDDVQVTVRNNSRTQVGDRTAEITGISGDASENYALPTNRTQQFSIVKAEIKSITLSDLTAVYNGTAQGVEVSSYVTQHGITVNVTYSGGEAKTADTVDGLNAFINVTGEEGKTITATISEDDYYEELTLTATVIITPSPITSITLTSRTVVYNGTERSISVNTTVTNYGDEVTVTYTINGNEGNSAKDAGTYTVVATIAADDDNYVTLTRTATLTINKADIDESRISVDEDFGTIIYNAQYHGIAIEVTDDETQYGDRVTITYYGGENNSGQAKNVGKYEINAVVSAGKNYNDYTTTKSTLTIAQKDINLTLRESDKSFTYDGNAHTARATFELGAENDTDKKVYDGDTVTVTLTYLGTSGVAQGDTVLKNSGKYTVSARLSTNNYRPILDVTEIVINKATIEGYYFVGDSFMYNKKSRALGINTENASLSDPIIRTLNLLSTDSGTVEYAYTTTEGGEYDKTFTGAVNAGTYYLKATITASGDAEGNYELWEKYATLVITPSTFTSFTMEEVSVNYNGLAHSITITVAEPEKQLINGVYYTAYGDKVTVTYTISDGKNDETEGNSAIFVNVVGGAVAAYTVTAHCSFEDDVKGNYRTDNLNISASLTILPTTLRNITLTGENAVYDGNAHNATLSLPSTAEYPRYELSADKTEFTVYLAEGHAGDVFTINEYIEDFEGQAIDAASYDFVAQIAIKDSSLKNNYTAISDLRKTIVISRAQAADASGTVYAQNENLFFNDGTITYCGGTHYIVLAFETALSVLSHNATDVITSLTLHPSTNTSKSDEADIVYTCDGAEFEGAKDVGTYVITARVSHKNYMPFTLQGTITIAQATVEYYFTGTTRTYDMETHFAAVSTEENTYVDDGTVTTIALRGSDTATVSYTYKLNGEDKGRFGGALYVGTYEITAKLTFIGDVGGNYEIWGTNDSMTVTLEITPYETEIFWDGLDKNYVYNGNPFAPVTAYFIGADGTTRVEATVSYEGISGKATGDAVMKNAGTYKLTATHARGSNYIFTLPDGQTDGDNYSFVSATEVNLSVKKAVIQRYLVSTSIPYAATTYFLALNTANAANVVEALGETTTVTGADITQITVYGETVTVVYTYTKSGANSKDAYMNDEGVKTTLTYGARNAGTYTVTADLNLGDGESNFESWTAPKTATLTINRLNLTVSSETNFVKTYDGTSEVTDYVINGVINSAEHITYVAEYSDKNAGDSKPITITANTTEGYEYLKDNYTLPSVSNGSILQRKLVLIENDDKAQDQTSLTFWRKPQYDGLTTTTHSPLPLTTANNLVAGDEVTLNSRYNSKNVKEANKVLFTLAGADKDNYTIDNLDFTSDVDFENGVYLIMPRVTDISWSTRTVDYNGRTQTVSAYLSVLGVDVANGQLNLAVSLQYTKDGNGNTLETPVDNATFRNAGTYVATASLPDGADANILANYGINTDTMVREFTIRKVGVAVTWSGLSSVYTYNGTNQASKVTATAALRGDDVNTYKDIKFLIAVFTVDGNETEFKNAGDYGLSAQFAESVRDELSNNYTLTNVSRTLTMNKATINNITFSGSDTWTYTDGTVHFYFVSNVDGKSFIVTVRNDGITVPVVYYEFDADTPMEIDYSGGDTSLDEINGNNGIRNVGTTGIRTITATITETDNYESWTGEITVTVLKGTINNVVMDSYAITYDGGPHYLYAHNVGASVGNGEYSQVKAPDGSTVTIKYEIEIGTYFNGEFAEAYKWNYNYATNAGTYLLRATITDNSGNYNDLVLPGNSDEPVTLTILQYKATVVWAYKNQTKPDFTYNAANQTSSVQASILGASTSGSQNRITLAVAISLLDEVDIPDELKSQFVIAGNYSMTASFTAADENEYQKLKNNYELSGQTVSVTMKKYVVEILWYKNPLHHPGEEKLPYDNTNPCIYDATTHGLIAEGYGVNPTVPMKINTSGTFEAVDAGYYNANVSSIVTGEEKVTINETVYGFDYDLNYTLTNTNMRWRIAPRPITISAADDNFLSKIYDGSAVFQYNANGYVKGFVADASNDSVGNVQIMYTTDNSAYDNSHFTYFINNVMAVDKDKVFLPITSITADMVNVNATNATVALGGLVMDRNSNGIYNYEINSVSDGIIQTNANVITPRSVEMRFQDLSHVYNGQTYSHEFTYAESINGGLQFNQKYGYTLFLFYNESSVRMQLVDGNYLTGSVSIGGNVNAGEYSYVISDLKVVDAETNGAENYTITISNLDTALYTIEKRHIAVNYSNLLQSRQLAFVDVSAELDISNSDITDLIVGEGENALTALNDLVKVKDGLTISIDNSWKSDTYNAYTRITGNVVLVGEDSDSPLTVFLNSGNYEVDAPVLQITYLQIESASEYKFFINNLDDLLHLDGDCYGLAAVRGESDILPTFTQTADIDGLVNGGHAVMPSIRNFRGHYVGDNHSIRNMTIAKIANSSADSAYTGFFARITQGSVENLTLINVHVYASSGVSSAGVFAGLIDESVTISNVTVEGTIYADADYGMGEGGVKVGGFVGTALGANVTTANVAVKMTVVNSSSDRLYVGGFAGIIDGGSYENVFIFADVSVSYKTAPTLNAYFGGIAGYVTGDENTVSNYRYLTSSVYVNDGESAILYDKAFGNDVTFNTQNSSVYDEFIAADDTLTEMISTYMIRGNLLPSGANGTAANPVTLTNFRQIALILAYPYMHFNVANDIRSPLSITTYHRGFYGVITYTNGGMRSDHPSNTSDIPLTDAVINSTQTVVIGKKEDNN